MLLRSIEQAGAVTPDALDEAVLRVQDAWPVRPRLGVLLGSGLGGLARLVACEARLDYSDIPSFPRVTAAGHPGEVVCGRLGGIPVVMLVGRSHLYEGYGAEQLAMPIRLLHGLGVTQLVLTNASGGLNPRFRRGDVMVIRDHLCFQFLALPAEQTTIMNSTRLTRSAYDESLAEAALEWARRNCSALQQGVYVAVTGPNYETRAEYRMFRNLGGDAVGMSTALEAVVAARLGMQTIGLSMIANVALPDRPQRVTHEEVLAAGALAEPVMGETIAAIARHKSGD